MLLMMVVCFLCITNSIADECLTLEDAFTKYLIVPFVIPAVPSFELSVRFYTKVVRLGNKIPTYAAVNPPVVYYNATPDSFYAIVIVDADVPSALAPIDSQYLHAMLLNIPGNNLSQSNYMTPYIPMNPLPGSGYHRIVILLYKQSYKIDVTSKFIRKLNSNYSNFNVTGFANRYEFGNAIGGNFFLCQLTVCEQSEATFTKEVLVSRYYPCTETKE